MELRNQLNYYFQKYERLLKIFSAGVLLRGGIVVINFITGIWIARELGEADRGLIFGLFLGALVLFNTAFNFGYNGSALYYAKKAPDKLPLYLTTNFIITGLSIVFILLAMVLFSFSLKFQSDYLRLVFVICYIMFSFSQIYRSFLLGMDENYFMQKFDFSTRILYIIFIGILCYFHSLTAISIAIFFTLEYSLFTWVAYRKVNLKFWPLKWDYAFFKENILFNSKSYIASILYMLLLKGDQFLIKLFFGNFQVGVYGIGSTIIENLFFFTALIATMYLPKLLEYENLEFILNKSIKILGIIFISSIGLSIVTFIMSPYIVEFYYNKPNPIGAESLRILLVGFVGLSLFIFNYYIYFSIRLKKSLIIILFIGVVLNLLLNYLYLPQYGILASAWASSICYSLVAILSFIDLYFLKKRNYRRKIILLDEER
jgi:O-antigen/teichoic acid export membrane protein